MCGYSPTIRAQTWKPVINHTPLIFTRAANNSSSKGHRATLMTSTWPKQIGHMFLINRGSHLKTGTAPPTSSSCSDLLCPSRPPTDSRSGPDQSEEQVREREGHGDRDHDETEERAQSAEGGRRHLLLSPSYVRHTVRDTPPPALVDKKDSAFHVAQMFTWQPTFTGEIAG